MAYWHVLGRDDSIRQYVKSRELHRGGPWCRSLFAPSVKGIDTVLCNVHLPCPPSPKNGVLVPLLRSYTTGPLKHYYHIFIHHFGTVACPAWRAILCRSLAARECGPLWRPSKFGTTLRIESPEGAWFRQARGPRKQNAAERGHLPGFAHLGIHVVLPGEHTEQPLVTTYQP